jgi:ATP-binding cassette, subfamily B, bacterial MsbA
MKEFFQLMRRFVSPYKKFLGWAVFLNLLSAVFNIFSFTLLIPILQILFKMDNKVYEFIPWDAAGSESPQSYFLLSVSYRHAP